MLGQFTAFFFRNATDAGAVFHVAHNGQPGEQSRPLIDHAAVRTRAMDNISVNRYAAARDRFKPGHAVDQGGFAALSGSEQDQQLVFAHVQIDFTDHIHNAAGSIETLADILANDDILAHFPLTLHLQSFASMARIATARI